MFTSISINNFRCFEELSIGFFDRVNLIAGKNNVGKTTLLEAIFLLASGANITGVAALANFRGIEKVNQPGGGELVFSPLFLNFKEERIVKISGFLKNGEQHLVEIEVVSSAFTGKQVSYKSDEKIGLEFHPQLLGSILQLQYKSSSGIESSKLWIEDRRLCGEMKAKPTLLNINFLRSNFHHSSEKDAENFGKLEVIKESSSILESLRFIEPRLKRLATIVVSGTPIVHGDIGLERMVPLYFMGEGLSRLTSILLAIANAPNGIVLIDEIENGIHHSVLKQIWQAIGDAARRFDTQVIATTHSYECIQAAHQAFINSKNYDFRLHRLDRIADKIRSVTYDAETLSAALKAELEVR